MTKKRKPLQENEKNNEAAKELNEKRLKNFIQMLDIKRDTNMTRIYSAIQSFK